MKAKKHILFSLYMLLTAFTFGCGQKETSDNSVISEQKERNLYDLSVNDWNGYETLENSIDPWTVCQYWDGSTLNLSHDGMITARREDAVENADYYILQRYLSAGGDMYQKYELIHLNLLTSETEKNELTLPDFSAEIQNGQTVLTGIDVLDGQICLLAVQYSGQKPEHVYVIWLNDSQTAAQTLDLAPEMKQAGILSENLQPESIRLDREGYIYLKLSGIAVFNREGQFLKIMESTDETANIINSTSRLPDGRPIFEYMDTVGETTLFTFDGQDRQILYQGECGYTGFRYINEYGEVIFVENGSILQWNTASGTCETIYKDAALVPWECRAIVESADGLSLVFDDGDELSLFQLKPGEAEKIVVTVYPLFDSSEIRLYAAEYSRTHPKTEIKIISTEQNEDKTVALNQLFAQISAGEGPDLFILNNRQLAILQEKCVLSELSELLPDELTAQIFPGVLQYGMVDDGLYGISISAGVSTMAVSGEQWNADTWTFRDVIEIMNAAEKSGHNIIGFSSTQSAYDQLLYELIIKDISAGTSSLIDTQQRQCRFDTLEFIQVLEFCRKYGVEPGNAKYIPQEEQIAALLDGRTLALPCGGNLAVFSHMLSALGDKYQCVGYPTDNGCGGFVSCSNCIAVNSNTPHKEAAKDFLQYLLSKNIQLKIGIGTVRRDILTNHVREHTEDSDGPLFEMGDHSLVPLDGKKDGSSFLPEYLELLENGTPEPIWLDDVGSIIVEEAMAYFNGDKEAEEAATVIQNRVQLYLDEL